MGAIPGKAGTPIFLKDSVKRVMLNQQYLNCPTFIPQSDKRYATELIMKARETDPFEDYLHDNDVVDKE